MGQCSSQTMQGPFPDQGRHLPRSKWADPMRMGVSILCVVEISWIAWVGQTEPHRVHVCSQYPWVINSVGVQKPAMPASVKVGLMALVGQAFMQRPQRWQRLRNSFSVTEPGGRMRSARDIPWIPPSRLPKKGSDTPAAKPPSSARLPISGSLRSFPGRRKVKFKAFSGHASKQLKQVRHSAGCQSTPGMGSAAP